jgi:hypothetical protein
MEVLLEEAGDYYTRKRIKTGTVFDDALHAIIDNEDSHGREWIIGRFPRSEANKITYYKARLYRFWGNNPGVLGWTFRVGRKDGDSIITAAYTPEEINETDYHAWVIEREQEQDAKSKTRKKEVVA